MLRSLVGSEMCIRDRAWDSVGQPEVEMAEGTGEAERPSRTKVLVPLAMTLCHLRPMRRYIVLLALAPRCLLAHPGDAGRCRSVVLRLAFVLVSAGTEFTLFLVAGAVLWFGFSVRILLITC